MSTTRVDHASAGTAATAAAPSPSSHPRAAAAVSGMPARSPRTRDRFARLLEEHPRARREHHAAEPALARSPRGRIAHPADGAAERRAMDGSTSDRKVPRRSSARDEIEGLAPFHPPPPALLPPPAAVAPPHAGSAAARAEAAALADRLVQSMRVGRVGRDGHEVRLRLRAADSLDASSGLEIRLRHEGGLVHATFVAESTSRAEAERIASALERELEERGVALGSVSIDAR